MSATLSEPRNSLWNDLQEIEDVAPVGVSDYACLTEIGAVLKKHGMQSRFGVALLHKHFDLQDGEMLVEWSNKEDRSLLIKAVPEADAGRTVGTIYRLGDGDQAQIVLGCMQYCGANAHGNHGSFHKTT